MEEPIKDPLDVSNELAEREKQKQEELQKTPDPDSDTKFEEENEQRPHSTELVIVNPSDVIIDKVNETPESDSSDNRLAKPCETVQKEITEALPEKVAQDVSTTKTDANRNEIERVSSPPIHESSNSSKAVEAMDSVEEKSNVSEKREDECAKSEVKENVVVENVEKEIQQKQESTVTKETEEKEKKDGDNEIIEKEETNTTVKVQNDSQNNSAPEKSLVLSQESKEGEMNENNSSSGTSNVQAHNMNESSKQNDSGNISVLKQATGSSMSSDSKDEKIGDNKVEKEEEEEEVSVSFLDRVIKHALNNTLPIGSFDSSKPFDMVNRRPGGLPNFNNQSLTVTSTSIAGSNNKNSESSVSKSGATISCDNDKEQVTSDLKGVIKKADEVVSLERSSSSSQNVPMVPKQETMSENQNLVVHSSNQNTFCDATDSNKRRNDSLTSVESNPHFVQQPVVTSSMSMNAMPSKVVQSTSQMYQVDDQLRRRSSQDSSKTEFTRQEIIDKKYKTKEDLKNARMVASRVENEQTLNLSLSDSTPRDQQSTKKNMSLYVSTPDFSKKIFSAPEVIKYSNPSNPLHVPPPDFNRAATQTKEMQIPNPVFKLKGGDESHLYKQNYRSSVPMTQEKLAEMSKTHNYIPDLRLKSQSTSHSIPVIQTHSNLKPNNVEEEPLLHIIHKEKYHELPDLQNTYITPVRVEPSKNDQPKLIEPKVHYPPYKLKHMMEPQASQQYKREDMQQDMNLRHLRMDHKDLSSQHLVNKSNKVPYPDQQSYLIDKHQNLEDRKHMYKMEETKYNILEQQQKEHEFSLKEKERQLRQEGTIITVKTSNEVKLIPQQPHHIPNVYQTQSHPHPSGSSARPPEPAKLTKENVDRHLRETKHLYPPGHPALSTMSKDMSLIMKPPVMAEEQYRKTEHIPEQHKPRGYYQSYNDNVKGGTYQKHSGYMHPPVQKSGSSEVAYYPNPSISPHGPMGRSPSSNQVPMGSMNPPVNWPNQKISPSPHGSSVSPINNMLPNAASPVFIHPSSKHSPSPTQFSRPPVAQSPTQNNKSVSPQLLMHQNQYRHSSYSPVHMPMQQKPGMSVEEKYRNNRRVAPPAPAQPPRHVVMYETGSGSRKYEYGEVPKNMRHEQVQQYPVMKYGQQIQQHDVPLRHNLSQENMNRSSREYEMHKYAQYGPERVELRRSESDLSRAGYSNEPPMHKQDEYRSHSLDRANYERQKEYDYHRARMVSKSPTESYKIQLDISAAIKHETNRNESPSRHHDPYHGGSSSRATMEVQSSPSPSHYQASILIRPTPSTSNTRMDPSPSHIKTETYVPPKEIRADITPTVITTPQHNIQQRPTVVAPLLKRESPLDLSVKTVKTMADSTGSDLSQQMYRRVDDGHVAPKVEFRPNFMQHQSGPPRPNVNERSHREQFEPNHMPQMHHPMASPGNVAPKYPQIRSPRSAPQSFESIPSSHKNVGQNVHHRLPEEPNVKYAEELRQRNQDIVIKSPQVNERTIHVEVGTPYRPNMLPSNSHKQMQRQEPMHIQQPPYPMNDLAGPSGFKPNQTRGSVINNSNDPQRLEDRKYVESILYKKQPPPSAIANAEITFRYVHDKPVPRPLSPRKRPSNYNEPVQVPPKQIRYGPPPNEMPSHMQPHVSHQYGGTLNYKQGIPEQKPQIPREQGVEIHAHKMIYERFPPESRNLQHNSQYPKPNDGPHPHPHPHVYADPNKPEPIPHPSVVKTIPKDSFRHDPKDSPRAGFQMPQHNVNYPPNNQMFFPRPIPNEEEVRLHQKQTAVTWHPSAPSSSRVIQPTPDRFDMRNQYNASADALDKCDQIPAPVKMVENYPAVIVEPKAPIQIPEQIEVTPVPSTNKGADITTINKLRNSIEQKEMERQRVLMRKQNSSEISEDDSNKADIASILAARIRTKGELKGFTMTSETPTEIPKEPIQPPADIEGTSAFDVMDWGNACNDFVDQLQTGKKRGRRKRNTKLDDSHEPNKIDPYTSTCAQADNLSTVPAEVLQHIEEPENFSNSSDEDKPLNLLRQQSTPEFKDEDSVGPRKGTETCSSTVKSGSSGDKVSQNIRKKQRLVLEQKIAARIGTGSSSDTEPEDKPSVRARKRKLRTRSSLGMKESDKSDENQKHRKGSDDDTNSELEEKIAKNISQLDGSSDSDNNQDKNQTNFRKSQLKNRSVSVKLQRLSRLEKHSEESNHSEEEKSSSKSKTPKHRKSKQSDSEGGKDETMTRSKRKLEMEKKISNSKVLRNDKIVQNVTTVKKSKNVQEVASKTNKSQHLGHGSQENKKKDDGKPENLKRKCLESDCEQNKSKTKKYITKNSMKAESSVSSSENDEKSIDDKNDRLRPRKTKPNNEVVKKVNRKNSKVDESKSDKKPTPTKKTSEKQEQPSQTKYPPGWEAQLYAFKKSLKIPARLINVTPNNQRYSTSLPDLDPQSSDEASEFSETSKASSFLTNIKQEETETEASSSRRTPSKRSIIDLLHQRVTPSLNKMMQKKKKQKELTHLAPKGSENELLPTPVVHNNAKSTDDMKKSIFDLSILKSRTRNEQKHMKHKEIIREIFCGEDRPSSAPPLGLDLDTTFDQKFGQIMKKMDDVVASTSTKIKQEKPDDTFLPPPDEETTDTVLNVERDNDDLADRDLDTPSVNSERDMITPVSFKDMPKPTKRSRQSRRKQSSGFDYIRKKKKPAPTNSDGTPITTKRRIAAVNYLQEKDESDISKEVKGWVLNKGVGECYLHKAARLGYLDVIAYCLFRIDMDVDTKDNAGYTALHEACSKGNLGIVRLLLQCGANHSETAFSGIRPLHEAVQNNYTEIARLLLAYGADPSLSTYSGQTPEMLAETKEMTKFISSYLKDMQGRPTTPWQMHYPWQQYDSDTEALDIFDGVSELFNETNVYERSFAIKSITKTCDSNLNNIIKDERIKYKSCSVVLNNIDHLKSFRPQKTIRKSFDTIDTTFKNSFNDVLSGNMDSDGEKFEFEESDYPLPPLYILQDEGSDKWIMLSDLCNILKVKSKDAVLKQIDPNTPTSTLSKELVKELKLSEFVEKASCLQLLCAGEKLNARASKVVLVRYNDAVKRLLNIQTIVLKF